MSKIIIENRTEADDITALHLVERVIQMGRISGSEGKRQYCYATVFSSSHGELLVVSDLNKRSDRFVVTWAHRAQDRLMAEVTDD